MNWHESAPKAALQHLALLDDLRVLAADRRAQTARPGGELGGEVNGVAGEIMSVRSELGGEIVSVRADPGGGIKSLRAEMHQPPAAQTTWLVTFDTGSAALTLTAARLLL